jgi:hypothetical protein
LRTVHKRRTGRSPSLNSKFHDGFLDGFLIRDPQVIIFLRTDGNEAFTLGL